MNSTFGGNNATSALTLTGQLATGKSDTNPALPAFTGANVQDQNGNTVAGYTLLIYAKISSTVDTIFTQTPGLTLTVGAPASVSGTSCALFSLNGSGTTYKQVITATTVTSTSVTFSPITPTGTNTVNIGNAGTNDVAYLAFACK